MKKSNDKMSPPVGIEPRQPLIQVQHYPFYTNLTFACKTEILGSLYSHALLILLTSSGARTEAQRSPNNSSISAIGGSSGGANIRFCQISSKTA